MVSLHSEQMLPPSDFGAKFRAHPWWDQKKGWKNILNNLRLLIQSFIFFYLIKPWLIVFPIPQLSLGFFLLQSIIHSFTSPIFIFLTNSDFYFSSA